MELTMAGDSISRRLRAALGNGVVWGAAWSALWTVFVTVRAVLGVVGILPPLSWLEVVGGILRFGIPLGILGFVAGGAFSGVIRLVYRGRRLREISALRFGIAGGIVAGLTVPLFMQAMNLLSEGAIVPWSLVLGDGIMTAAFGGIAAAASLGLARRGDLLITDGSGEGGSG